MGRALFLLALFLSVPARATLTPVDLFRPGDGLVTRDTESGIDWIDLHGSGFLPTGSYLEVVASDWYAQGWRHARHADVCGLVAQIGTTCPGDVWFGGPETPFQEIEAIWNLFGSIDLEEQWDTRVTRGLYAPSSNPESAGLFLVSYAGPFDVAGAVWGVGTSPIQSPLTG